MIRAVIALLLTACIGHAASAERPDPQGTIALAADADARWVDFDLTPGNQIRFRMTVDDKPVTAILDTGVSYSVLARRSAAADPARIADERHRDRDRRGRRGRAGWRRARCASAD